MSDLFSFGRATDNPEVSYGSTGDMKKTQYVLQLLGFPGHADTIKCLITAVEMGLETDTAVLDVLEDQSTNSEFLEFSPFEILPVLKEADYTVAGATAIMSYIEARGLGTRLPPNNVALLAKQNYWSDIACTEVSQYVETIVQEQILSDMSNSASNPEDLAQAYKALSAPFTALDQELANNKYIIGNYSFADIHWSAYIHLLYEAGEGNFIDKHTNIKRWFDQIRSRKSFSGQNIVAYDLLPKLIDIQSKQLNSVVIDDY